MPATPAKSKYAIFTKSAILEFCAQPSQKIFFFVRLLPSQRPIPVSLFCALIVWILWLALIGPSQAFSNFVNNWKVAITMIFGSMIAGGTSMGGGAVAFPVLTKVLHVPPHNAKLFSLAIQSVGMSAASLAIIAMRIQVEWCFIRCASLGGFLGFILGSGGLAPILPPEAVKVAFTMLTK